MSSSLSYVPGSSVLHEMNPITKILLALCICAAAFISGNLYFLVGIIIIDLLIGVIGGIFKKALSVFKGLLRVSIFLFVLQVLFIRDGRVLFLFITEKGVITALSVVLRLMGACMPLALVLATTQPNDLANSMVSVLHIPYKYAFTLSTSIKFIPLFASEMAGIKEAQTARGVEFDTKNFFKKIGLILPLCVPLLISSVRKTESTALAAEMRGFELRTGKSGYKTYPFKAVDISAFIFSAAIIAAAIIL